MPITILNMTFDVLPTFNVLALHVGIPGANLMNTGLTFDGQLFNGGLAGLQKFPHSGSFYVNESPCGPLYSCIVTPFSQSFAGKFMPTADDLRSVPATALPGLLAKKAADCTLTVLQGAILFADASEPGKPSDTGLATSPPAPVPSSTLTATEMRALFKQGLVQLRQSHLAEAYQIFCRLVSSHLKRADVLMEEAKALAIKSQEPFAKINQVIKDTAAVIFLAELYGEIEKLDQNLPVLDIAGEPAMPAVIAFGSYISTMQAIAHTLFDMGYYFPVYMNDGNTKICESPSQIIFDLIWSEKLEEKGAPLAIALLDNMIEKFELRYDSIGPDKKWYYTKLLGELYVKKGEILFDSQQFQDAAAAFVIAVEKFKQLNTLSGEPTQFCNDRFEGYASFMEGMSWDNAGIPEAARPAFENAYKWYLAFGGTSHYVHARFRFTGKNHLIQQMFGDEAENLLGFYLDQKYPAPISFDGGMFFYDIRPDLGPSITNVSSLSYRLREYVLKEELRADIESLILPAVNGDFEALKALVRKEYDLRRVTLGQAIRSFIELLEENNPMVLKFSGMDFLDPLLLERLLAQLKKLAETEPISTPPPQKPIYPKSGFETPELPTYLALPGKGQK